MNKKLKKVLNLQPHFSIADSIPLISINEDGIIEVKPKLYSKTYKVQDINFGIARQEEKGSIVGKWSNLLKALDPSWQMQICVYNHSADIDYLSDSVLLGETGDGKDALRKDINRIIKKNMTEGDNAIRRDILLTLTIPADDMTSATKAFLMAENNILGILRQIPGCSAEPLKSMKRLNLLHDIYHGGSESEMHEFGVYNCREQVQSFSLDNLYNAGVTAKELIQPASMEFRTESMFANNQYFILGDKFGRALDLKYLPTIVRDTFLRDFTDMPFPMLMTLNVSQINALEASKLVRNKRALASSNLAQVQQKSLARGYDPSLANPELKRELEEAEYLLEDIERRDQKLYEMKGHVVIFANSLEELDEYSNRFLSLANTKSTVFAAFNGLQENSFVSAMPWGFDCTTSFRTVTTEVLGIMVPFSSQEMAQKNGTVYGINKISRNLISYNRMSGDNYNMIILGSSGSGKSFFAKKEILSTYLKNADEADVIIIDPQNEYGPLCRAVGGEEIIIKGAGEHHINPMDININYGDNPIPDKVDFMYSVCSQMLGGVPDPIQKSAINLAAKRCYDAWKLNPVPENVPVLEDFYNALVNYYNADNLQSVLDLLKSVEYYVSGTDTLFQGETNCNTDAGFITYNISSLGEAVKPLAMLVILDSILNRMSANQKRGRATYIYLDEAHLLFANEITGAWCKNLWKLARKFMGCPAAITQDVEDLLQSDTGRALITNSSFVVLLKQAELNKAILANQLQLSDDQLGFISDVPSGEGLLGIANSSKRVGGVIPFEDRFPTDSMLYKICQTSDMSVMG